VGLALFTLSINGIPILIRILANFLRTHDSTSSVSNTVIDPTEMGNANKNPAGQGWHGWYFLESYY